METLFGLSMTSIATMLGTTLGLVVIVLLLLAWRRPVMFKLGLRPIPRRRAQSALIVGGLMLATLIITAAFITGDTLAHTIRTLAIQGLGEIDEQVRVGGGSGLFEAGGQSPYFKLDRYEALAAQLADYELVDAIIPAINESAPVVNAATRQSLSGVAITGLRPEDVAVLARGEITDAQGNLLSLNDLGLYEVYLNAKAARELGAEPGQTLDVYVAAKPKRYTVRAIAVQGDSARLLMSLRQAQMLFNQRGKINRILISNQGDALTGVQHSAEVTTHLRGLLADQKVASQLFNLLAGDPAVPALLRAEAEKQQGNTQKDLRALADGLEAGALTPLTLSLLADDGLAGRVQRLLADAQWQSKSTRNRVALLFANLSELGVDDIKRDLIDNGELAANVFTTIFIVSGLFGIAAGLVLIFLIFVMLAAERKSEMGMTRAVGGQRRHLIEMFVFEGTAYDLLAAAVGVALGVGLGILIATTLGQAFAAQEAGLVIQPSVTPRSVVVAYSLGMLVTFVTVLLSAYRVSKLNIVAAIRDLPEPPPAPRAWVERLLAPVAIIVSGFDQLFRRQFLHALWTWWVSAPLSLLRLVWLGFAGGPFTLLLGLALVPLGMQTRSAAAYSLGISFTIIGLGLVLRGMLGFFLKRRRALVDRLAFSALGLLLAVYWSLPFNWLEQRFGIPDMNSGPEMLFISGILLVAGAVLVLMYNTDLLLAGVMQLLGGAPRFAPVLRMAIAYPLSNRFRTGMTIGIFAVVVFSVIFMATLFRTNSQFFARTEKLTGGFDLRVTSSNANPIADLKKAIARSPNLRYSDYAIVAAQTDLGLELQKDTGQWASYPVRGVDAAYLENITYGMSLRAAGYDSDEAVWQAVRDRPGYAVIDRFAVASRFSGTIVIGGPEFKLPGVYLEDKTMQPVRVKVRDPNSEATFEVTVIGVIEQEAYLGFGLIVARETLERNLRDTLPAPTHYVRLAEGVRPGPAGRALENVFFRNGVQSVDLVAEIQTQQRVQRVFEQLLLGFLTLGLVVGVAALGVISTRAVVERRQQIGMLRALGFQRSMVAWSFLIESSFVALLGILLGIGLGLIPAYYMIEEMRVQLATVRFEVPWTEMVVVFGLAYGMALLTTWLPAIQASRVAPAEALRYE